MARGNHLDLEEARRSNKLDRFAKENPLEGDLENVERRNQQVEHHFERPPQIELELKFFKIFGQVFPGNPVAGSVEDVFQSDRKLLFLT